MIALCQENWWSLLIFGIRYFGLLERVWYVAYMGIGSHLPTMVKQKTELPLKSFKLILFLTIIKTVIPCSDYFWKKYVWFSQLTLKSTFVLQVTTQQQKQQTKKLDFPPMMPSTLQAELDGFQPLSTMWINNERNYVCFQKFQPLFSSGRPTKNFLEIHVTVHFWVLIP